MPHATHDPDAVEDFTLNWAVQLDEGDTISSSTWHPPEGITVGSGDKAPSNTGTTTTVWISGGTLGVRYDVVNRVVTAGGRTLDSTLYLHVTER